MTFCVKCNTSYGENDCPYCTGIKSLDMNTILQEEEEAQEESEKPEE